MSKLAGTIGGLILVLVGAIAIAWIASYLRLLPQPSPPTTPSSASTTPSSASTTPCGNQATLRWTSADRSTAVLDGNTIVPGKAVLLDAVFPTAPPKALTVFERFDSVLDLLGYNRTRQVTPPFGVKIVTTLHAHSDKEWIVADPPLYRGQSVFFIKDECGNESGELTSSHLSSIISAGVNIGAKIVHLDFGLHFSVDPSVDFIVLVPWGTGASDLTTYVDRHMVDLGQTQGFDSKDAMLRLRTQFGLPDKAPTGWQLGAVRPVPIVKQLGNSTTISVEIQAPSAAKTLLALKVVDHDDPSRFSVSDLIPIDVPAR